MPPAIDLRAFQGLHTNADPADIDPRRLLRLKNLIARAGRLRKGFTPGFTGDQITLAPPAYQVKNLIHYSHNAIFGAHALLAGQISPRSNHVRLDALEGGNPYLTDDVAALLGFNDPYEFPTGVTMTLTTTHPIQQTGAQTVAGTLFGLSADTGADLYWGKFQLGIYDFADILYNTLDPTTSLRTPIDVTEAMYTSGTWSVSRTLFAGIKIVRLERINWDLNIISATTSASLNTATVTVLGRVGVPVPSGELEPNVTYWVYSGSVAYNGTIYTGGQSFVGVADVDTFTGSGVLHRNAVIGDELWIYDSGGATSDGYQRVLNSSYDSGVDQTTFTLRDAMTDDPSGVGDLRGITAVGSVYNNRAVPRTYSVPRSTHTQQNQLFNIIGERDFSYAHAMGIIGLTAYGDQANAEAMLLTLLQCQYPLAHSGVHGPGIADGNFAFSYYVHGYNPGPYLRGDDQVANGDFDTDTVWSKGTGWTIPGAAGADHAGATSDLTQTSVFDAKEEFAGMRARITFDVTSVSGGSVTPYVEGTAGTERSTVGTFTEAIAIAATTDDLIFRANGTISIDNVVVTIECDSILAPDPYFRTGASGWIGMALAFFAETYPGSDYADSAEEAGIYLLDHLIDTYLITDSGHPHEDRFRGGQGWYDYLDPAYTWHPDRIIKWISTEHNIDMWWFLDWAVDLAWVSVAGHNYTTLRDNLKTRLLGNRGTSTWGHWWPGGRRALQGGASMFDVQGVDGQGRLVIRGDATSIFPAGTSFTVARTGVTIA